MQASNGGGFVRYNKQDTLEFSLYVHEEDDIDCERVSIASNKALVPGNTPREADGTETETGKRYIRPTS